MKAQSATLVVGVQYCACYCIIHYSACHSFSSLRTSLWNASSGRWRTASPWRLMVTRIQWAIWRRRSMRWRRRWRDTCRSTRTFSTSSWPWISRLPPTGSCWRERSAGWVEKELDQSTSLSSLTASLLAMEEEATLAMALAWAVALAVLPQISAHSWTGAVWVVGSVWGAPASVQAVVKVGVSAVVVAAAPVSNLSPPPPPPGGASRAKKNLLQDPGLHGQPQAHRDCIF